MSRSRSKPITPLAKASAAVGSGCGTSTRPMRHIWRRVGELDVRCRRPGCATRKRFKTVTDGVVCVTQDRGCRSKTMVRHMRPTACVRLWLGGITHLAENKQNRLQSYIDQRSTQGAEVIRSGMLND